MTVHALALQGEMTISAAAALRLHLLSTLAELGDSPGSTLRLDLQAVETIDSAGIQLLLSLRASLASRGQQLELGHARPVVRDALHCVGLGRSGSALVLSPQDTEVSA